LEFPSCSWISTWDLAIPRGQTLPLQGGRPYHYNPFIRGCRCLGPYHCTHNGLITCRGFVFLGNGIPCGFPNWMWFFHWEWGMSKLAQCRIRSYKRCIWNTSPQI
jgi:hypothetical protein